MSNPITLFEIYTQYKNGNYDILNQHVSAKPQFFKNGRYKGTRIQTDCDDIEGIVRKTYNDFLRRYPRYGNENSISHKEFRCELNDIYIEFFHVFLNVSKSGDDIANQNQLCSIIKKALTEQIRNKYLYIDFTVNEREKHDADDDNEKYSLYDNVAYKQYCQKDSFEKNGSFLHDIKEIHRILISIPEIKCLFPPDTTTQIRLIELLKSNDAFYYKYNDLHLKKMSDISAMINKSGDNLSEERITQSLNRIYNTLIKCAIGYVPCNRKDYAKTTSNTHIMLSDQTEQAIYKYCKLNPQVDKKYTNYLSLLIIQVNAVVDVLKQKGFSPSTNQIIDICLFNYEPDYWHFTECKNKKYRIYHYSNQDATNSYTLKRSKTVELDELPQTYVIGNCVIYADQIQNELYYLQKENRIFSVTKRDNQYIGYRIKYDFI